MCRFLLRSLPPQQWLSRDGHESFDDDEVAAAMNGAFVCIKVDRESGPDMEQNAVYMNAHRRAHGRASWTMTCFLTPGGRPF